MPGDLAALAALRAAVGWSVGGLEGSLQAAAAGRQSILLAEVEGHLVGAVTASFASHGGGPACGHISDLLVSPFWRRRGIATSLLDAAEDALRRRGLQAATLDVDAHNDAALRLYLGRGYRPLRPAQFPWGPGHTLRKVLQADAPVPRRAGRFWALLLRRGEAHR